MQKRTPIVKLEGINDRASAESLVDAGVYALLSESRPDGEDAWLVSELVGLEVYLETKEIGCIKGVINNPAHDILEIETGGELKMLPLVDVFVQKVDTDEGAVYIMPPDGWFES